MRHFVTEASGDAVSHDGSEFILAKVYKNQDEGKEVNETIDEVLFV